MHNAAYAALGIDATYLAFDVPPADLAAAVTGLRALGARQLSISIPHKIEIIGLLDEVEQTARDIGAVNTVVGRDGALHGSNTDWIGAVRALEQEIPLGDARAVVLGAGGTARAIVYGLLRRGAKVTILNRTPERARALADALGAGDAGPLDALAHTPHDLLVNTTSVGLRSDASPADPDAIAREAVVMDAVYAPLRTRLVRDAEARGARTITGKWMLVHQAVAQLQAWAGDEWDPATVSKVTEVMAGAFDAAPE
jgi:shikimate dehydrogenase